MGSYVSSYISSTGGSPKKTETNESPPIFSTPRAELTPTGQGHGLHITYRALETSTEKDPTQYYIEVMIKVPDQSGQNSELGASMRSRTQIIKISVPKYLSPRDARIISMRGADHEMARDPEVYLSKIQASPARYVKQYYWGSIISIESIRLIREHGELQSIFLPSERPEQLADQLHQDPALLETYMGARFRRLKHQDNVSLIEHQSNTQMERYCQLIQMEVVSGE